MKKSVFRAEHSTFECERSSEVQFAFPAMSKKKLRIHQTETDNLVSNLRGEVGEIITTWTIMRHLMAQERQLGSDDIARDLQNQELVFVTLLAHKLDDELVARLSELAETKVGRLNFHFASIKLNDLNNEVERFKNFTARNGFQTKRNSDISHKELPEKWSDHKYFHVPYRKVLRAVALASSIMKKIDRKVLGPGGKYLWHEMKERRYSLMNPPSSAYMLLPYLKLSNETRKKVILEEIAEGRQVWSEKVTKINGREQKVQVCERWGAIILGHEMIVLDRYPLRDISEITFDSKTDATPKPFKPVYETKKMTTPYRVISVDEKKISFEPSDREYRWDDGATTQLTNITVNLNDKLKRDMGEMKVGDIKEFTLEVVVLTGFEPIPLAEPPDS